MENGSHSLTSIDPEDPVTPLKPSRSWIIVILVLLILFLLGVTGYMYYQNQLLKKQPSISNLPPVEAVPTKIPSLKPSPIPEEITTKPNHSLSLKPGSDWLSYADNEAGITLKYPPIMSPKFHSNRGVASNFKAGSYLLNQSGETVLDFYFYPYNGGSRRQAFYDAVSFDGPENPSQFTQSTSDVSLNNRSFLKLKTSYTKEEGGRIFYLTPVGDRLYYFTYPAKLEANKALTQTLQTIIASSILNLQSTPFPNQTYVGCLEYADTSNKGKSWDAFIDNNQNMVVIQRFSQILKPITFDHSKINLFTNLQSYTNPGWDITDYTIKQDPSQKGSFDDAIVITLPKSQVEKIRAATQTTIPSISFSAKISQSFETINNEQCGPWSSQQTYYTNYP